MLGRRVELAAFQGLLADVAGGGRGRCVLVEGEPGIGKTALLTAVLRRAGTVPGLTVCAAAAAEPSARRPPLSVIFEALGTDPEPARPAEASEEPNPLAAYAVERVLALVERRLADGPLLLAVDDLHAADDASLLVWQRLYAVSTHAPLLLVGTLRPVPRRPPISRLRRILKDYAGLTLRLDRLAADDISELAAGIAGARPGPRLAGAPRIRRRQSPLRPRAGGIAGRRGRAGDRGRHGGTRRRQRRPRRRGRTGRTRSSTRSPPPSPTASASSARTRTTCCASPRCSATSSP